MWHGYRMIRFTGGGERERKATERRDCNKTRAKYMHIHAHTYTDTHRYISIISIMYIIYNIYITTYIVCVYILHIYKLLHNSEDWCCSRV